MNKTMKRRKIVCIIGPTACHKTECAIELAKRVSGEIVSADSVQVYFGMDIGSAKPDQSEREGISHHLIDCVNIETPDFSVSMYRDMASLAIEQIASRGSTPIVAGGSGLYVSALTYPLGFAIPRDDETRSRVSREYDENPELAFSRLIRFDPDTAKRLHPNDKKRIVRALEVLDCSGKPLSSFGADFQNSAALEAPFDPLIIGLKMEREQLYRRIDQRVEKMMEAGLEQEARRIYDHGYDRSLPAMRSIGYQQLFQYFDGACTLQNAVDQIKQDTRRFAKRQMTWFRRDMRISWHDVTEWEAVKGPLIDQITQKTQEWMKG